MCIEDISSGNTSSANYIVQLKLQYLLVKLGKKKKEKEKKASCVFSTFNFSPQPQFCRLPAESRRCVGSKMYAELSGVIYVYIYLYSMYIYGCVYK